MITILELTTDKKDLLEEIIQFWLDHRLRSAAPHSMLTEAKKLLVEVKEAPEKERYSDTF